MGQAAKMAKKDQKLQEELDRQREIKKEQQRLEDVVRPHEKAIQKMKEVELNFHQRNNDNVNQINSDDCSNNHNKDDDDDDDDNDDDRRTLLCESKQFQLDEVLALQAIYVDTETLKISEASNLEELQNKLDDWKMDPDRRSLQQTVIDHPMIALTMNRSIEDEEYNDMIAHILVHVIYQNNYPLQVPTIQILWFLVTKKSAVTSSNKPLESLGVLDEVGLIKSMSDHANEYLLGMPSVYELLDTWLGEHLSEFINYPSR